MNILEAYKQTVLPMLKYNYPFLTDDELDKAVEYSIVKRCKDHDILLHNSYKDSSIKSSIKNVADYILEKEPILTAGGTMFRKHGEVPNPIAKLYETFMNNRNIQKKEMFKYPKGSELFEKYFLLQLLSKIDANALYGAGGMSKCVYYNLYVAGATTAQARLSNAIASVSFEGFLCNNYKFRNLDEVIEFINNILSEDRIYKDEELLQNIPSDTMTFEKIVETCGHGYTPDDEDLQIIWDIVSKLPQEDLTRIFYKNNLFAFVDNPRIIKAFTIILTKLDKPYMNPNKAPKEIEAELDQLWSIIKEFVFYDYGVIDPIDRLSYLPRATTLFADTDSNAIHLDPWYEYMLDKIKDIPMKIKGTFLEPVSFYGVDEFEDRVEEFMPVEVREPVMDYDFYSDEVIALQKSLEPAKIIPQEGLRYSIINIMCFILDKLINEVMITYTKNANSYADGKKCLMIMKNEYLMKTLLLTLSMRNYASWLELQEGVFLKSKNMDIKGLSIMKSTLNEKSRKAFTDILIEEIMNADEIDQLNILKRLIILEKDIHQSLSTGSKEFYKPVNVKSMGSYADPMGQHGIKASVAWNEIRGSEHPGIDLTTRNAVDIVKVKINKSNVDLIKESHPDRYEDICKLLENEFYMKKGIDALAIPINTEVPDWVIQFIDYTTIINANLRNFKKPLEAIGIEMFDKVNINYTNIVSL